MRSFSEIKKAKNISNTCTNFDNIRYLVDTGIIELLYNTKKPSKRIYELLRDFIRKKLKYLRWDSIRDIADAYGLPPEYIIDEKYYFDNYRYAPYKIIYAAWYKMGLTPQQFKERLVRWFYDSPRPPLFMSRLNKYNIYEAVKGRKRTTRYIIQAMELCCMFLGMKLHELYKPVKSLGADQVFVRIHDDLRLLSRVDVIVLYGIIRLFILYPPGENKKEMYGKLKELADRREVVVAGEQKQSN